MAKSRPSGRSKGSHRENGRNILNGTQVPRSKTRKSQVAIDPATLLAQATALLHTGQPGTALPLVQRALNHLQSLSGYATPASLPALNLLGEVYIELGEAASATETFLLAARIDPDGLLSEREGGGAEKFLWLAQLCEEGGEQSLEWLEKGVQALQKDIEILASERDLDRAEKDPAVHSTGNGILLEEKRRKLAAALCGMVEVWMTDLSWVIPQLTHRTKLTAFTLRLSPNAEATCTSLIRQALAVSPNPSTLQTYASLLLSQCKFSEARSALTRSLSLWQNFPPDHPDIPDFSTRISLSRLLMEAEMEEQAMIVLEGLVAEDDSSVEGWYLGGWCALLMAGIGRPDSEENIQATNTPASSKEIGNGDEAPKTEMPRTGEQKEALLITGREWLQNSLRLYDMQEYGDDRLRDHAAELVEVLDHDLEEAELDEDGDVENEEWEDDESQNVDGNVDSGGGGGGGQEADSIMNGT
ncbi:hypothetical protein MMC13_007625 [Lambiella insularis]|nr:hypothetical protein [Lambiella insularis]